MCVSRTMGPISKDVGSKQKEPQQAQKTENEPEQQGTTYIGETAGAVVQPSPEVSTTGLSMQPGDQTVQAEVLSLPGDSPPPPATPIPSG